MSRRPHPISFRFNIILAFSMLVSLMLGAVVFFEMVGLPGMRGTGKVDSYTDKTLDEMELVSGLLSQRLAAWFQEGRNDLGALAKSVLLRQGVQDGSIRSTGLLWREFASFAASHPGVASISLFNPDGSLRAGSDPAIRPSIDAFAIGRDNLAKLVLPGYTETIRLHHQPDGATFLHIIHQVYSLTDPNRLVGLLVTESDIGTALVQLIWPVSNELSPDWECIIASADGPNVTMIRKSRQSTDPLPEYQRLDSVFQPIKLALTGIEGPWDGLDAYGTGVLAFHRQVKISAGIALALVLKVNRDLALRPAKDDLMRQILLWVCLLAGVIGLGIIMANQMSSPIKSLVLVAHRIEEGDLSARALVRGNSEIGRLAGVFNNMLVRLEGLNRNLENQVQDRTKELRLLSLRQNALLTAVPDIIIEVDSNQRIIWANRSGCNFFGDDLIGQPAATYFTGGSENHGVIQPLFEGSEEPIYIESWQRRQDGETRLLAWWCRALVDDSGLVTGILSTARDITEQRLSEEKRQQSLREKETLLQEIHHRTKNTLQMIQGLLVLQAASVPESQEFQALVADTDQRIQAISLVHQMLYRSKDLSRISIKDYMSELAGLILAYSGRTDGSIKLDVRAIERRFPLDTVIPLGLILNELLTNSLKYAFPDHRPGRITIGLEDLGETGFVLNYADTGVGLPADFNFRGQASLGMRLIYSIGEQQMQGNVEFSGHQGVSCRFQFPDLRIAARV